jgi:hypothetical protein
MAVSFGDQDGHGAGATAQWQVGQQCPDAVVGVGGVQRAAVMWPAGSGGIQE